MNTIEIRTRGFGLSQALADHCQMHFGRAIRLCAQHVGRVTVILLDINGDHGGEDKSCRAILSLPQGPTFTVEAVDRDLYRAICLAATRLKRSLRNRSPQHRGSHRAEVQRGHSASRPNYRTGLPAVSQVEAT